MSACTFLAFCRGTNGIEGRRCHRDCGQDQQPPSTGGPVLYPLSEKTPDLTGNPAGVRRARNGSKAAIEGNNQINSETEGGAQ
jgi:hypothetical protein